LKSLYFHRLASCGGIELMDDLGQALAGSHGPVRCSGRESRAHSEIRGGGIDDRNSSDPSAFDRMLANYDPPVGNARFTVLAGFFDGTSGGQWARKTLPSLPGQTAFFFFSISWPESSNGARKSILLPRARIYRLYEPRSGSGFCARSSRGMEFLPEHRSLTMSILRNCGDGGRAALCVSRPTNPQATFLQTTRFAAWLTWPSQPACKQPIDNAYGLPFLDYFGEVTPSGMRTSFLP
jgi:alanine-alpha-ketoisovalerate/valine-pyruvate aminotransferase